MRIKFIGQDAQVEALKWIVEHAMPGRWDDARLPNATEMVSTGVIEVQIVSASAKTRSGNIFSARLTFRSFS